MTPKMSKRTIDIVGNVYGRLTVIGLAGYYLESPKSKKTTAYWFAQCECDKTILAKGTLLKTGKTKSCGCYASQCSSERIIKIRTTHGESRSRLYAAWHAMRDRCFNSHNKHFNHYGGRGIGICSEWNSYEGFRDWALTNGYVESLSIDRINNELGYSPDNCRWVELSEQPRNRRGLAYATINGERKLLSDWARESGLSHNGITRRYERGIRGKKLLTPHKIFPNTVFTTINNETKSLRTWAEVAGIPTGLILRRYRDGIRGESLVFNGRLPKRTKNEMEASNCLSE